MGRCNTRHGAQHQNVPCDLLVSIYPLGSASHRHHPIRRQRPHGSVKYRSPGKHHSTAGNIVTLFLSCNAHPSLGPRKRPASAIMKVLLAGGADFMNNDWGVTNGMAKGRAGPMAFRNWGDGKGLRLDETCFVRPTRIVSRRCAWRMALCWRPDRKWGCPDETPGGF
jgi:hypothetical protein